MAGLYVCSRPLYARSLCPLPVRSLSAQDLPLGNPILAVLFLGVYALGGYGIASSWQKANLSVVLLLPPAAPAFFTPLQVFTASLLGPFGLGLFPRVQAASLLRA